MAPLSTQTALISLLLSLLRFSFGLDQLLYDGESGEFHCDGNPEENGDIYWYKTNYTEGLDHTGRLITSYSQNGGLQMADEYADRGVLLSLLDGRLYFPVIRLSDEGEYVCSVMQGRNYTFTVQVYGDLLLSAPVMPILMDSLLSASCTVEAIRPGPIDFYWHIGNMRVPGVNATSVIDSTYNVLSITNTFNHTVGEEDDGELLSCVLVWVDGVELHRSLRIHLFEEDESVPNNELGRIIAGACIAGFVVIVVFATIIVVERKRKAYAKEEELSSNARSNSDNTYTRTPHLSHGRMSSAFTISGNETSRDRGYLLPGDPIAKGEHNNGYEEPRRADADARNTGGYPELNTDSRNTNTGGYLEPMSLQTLSQRENHYDNANCNSLPRETNENIYHEI